MAELVLRGNLPDHLQEAAPFAQHEGKAAASVHCGINEIHTVLEVQEMVLKNGW